MSQHLQCPLCGLGIQTYVLARHQNKSRCIARQAAAKLFDLGLRPVELVYQAKSDHAAEALKLFSFTVELHRTRLRLGEDTGNGNEAWTSEEGVALALTIEEIARLLGTSYPEAARRLHEHQDLLGPFATAWRLGNNDNKDDNILRELLKTIDYIVGSDGKRRERQPYDVRYPFMAMTR